MCFVMSIRQGLSLKEILSRTLRIHSKQDSFRRAYFESRTTNHMRGIDGFLMNALAAIVVMSPFVIFFALPVFDGGVFRQVETVASVLHGLAALAAMLMLQIALTRSPVLLAAFRDPSVLSLLGIALAGLVTISHAADWARSLHGTLEHGVGILWHAETAILAVAAIFSWRSSPSWRPFIASAPALSVVICGALQYLNLPYGDGGHFVVYDFREYLGIDAMLAAAPLFALRTQWATIAGFLLIPAGALLSGNRSVALGALGAAAVATAVRFLPRIDFRRWLAPASAVLVLGGALALPCLPGLFEAAAIRGVDPLRDAPSVASTIPVDHVDVSGKFYGTLWQRSVSASLVEKSMLAKPVIFFTGNGFGSFDEVAETYRRSASGRQMPVATETSSLTYWDGWQKARFHSHNAVWEMLLSAGVLAAAAWLGLVWSVARLIDRSSLLAGATLLGVIGVVGSLWFFVNAAAPLFAIAIASVVASVPSMAPATTEGGEEDSKAPDTILPIAVGVVLTLCAIAFALAATFAGSAVVGEKKERAFIPMIGDPKTGAPACVGYEDLTISSRESNRALYDLLSRRILDEATSTKDKTTITSYVDFAAHRINLANFSCLMRNYSEDSHDVLALLTSLRARAEIGRVLGKGEGLVILSKVLGPDFHFWPDDIDKLLAVAPGRTDVIVPYIEALDPVKQKAAIKRAVQRFAPRVLEGDPVRAWLMAKEAQADDKPVEEYRGLMRTALEQGLANLIPVSKGAADSYQGAAK